MGQAGPKLLAGLQRLMGQAGRACGMLVQVVEHHRSVWPTEQLPVPHGLHAAGNRAQQALPILVKVEGLFVQLSPPLLQCLALGH